MNPRLPTAARPLVLLTGGVLAIHLLMLRQSMLQQPVRAPALRALATRIVHSASPAPLQAPPPEAVRTSKVSPLPPRPAPAPVPSPIAPLPLQASAPPAPQPAVDMAPAPAPSSPSPPSPSVSFAIPGSARLRYDVAGFARGQAWNSTGELLWRHDGSQYEAALEYSTPSLRSRTQRSTGRITAQGLAPLRFSDRSRGERATHFERETDTLIFSSNAPPAALLPGAQDRLSVFMQLASMLAAAPGKFPAGTAISLQTAGTRDAESWLFTVEADESLTLPGGTVETRKLVRLPRRDYDSRVELWLGVAMDYVPVRIRLTLPNGDFVDQQWSSTDRS